MWYKYLFPSLSLLFCICQILYVLGILEVGWADLVGSQIPSYFLKINSIEAIFAHSKRHLFKYIIQRLTYVNTPVTTTHSRDVEQKISAPFAVIPSPNPQATPDPLAVITDKFCLL